MVFVVCCFYSRKKLFRITIRVSSSLNPDRARHFVVPDLGPSCLHIGYKYTTLVGKRSSKRFMASKCRLLYRMLVQIKRLYSKQCGPRSGCSLIVNLDWVMLYYVI